MANTRGRIGGSFPWSFETNWKISHGSLDGSITFESPDFPVESEASVDGRKPPLVLEPSSSDSGPCEIKISFAQKHEICQVYVRSTARIYEVYCASAPSSDNEYLCTVRCSVAARKQESFCETIIERSMCVNPNGSSTHPAEENLAGQIVVGTDEEDWVDVEVPKAPFAEQNSSLPKHINGDTRNFQDFFEATAEINDTDPCTSIMLRLLSLQSKECAYVSEIYVFADPVETCDSENQVFPSGSSSVMTMILPTLLQLSKSGVGRGQDKNTTNLPEQPKPDGIKSKVSASFNETNVIRQEDNLNASACQNLEFHVNRVGESDQERSESVDKNDLPSTQFERLMEQLVSRVTRIEEICLHFEEKMLKPINSIEERLQQVEYQVDMLAKNSQLRSCTRFTAPLFSSASSSVHEDANDSEHFFESGLDNKDSIMEKNSNPRAAQFHPSLVISAPEFSSSDEEGSEPLEILKKFSTAKPKQALSIDDALAAALTGFSSNACVQLLKEAEIPKIHEHDSDCFQAVAPEWICSPSDDDELSVHSHAPEGMKPDLSGKGNNINFEDGESVVSFEEPTFRGARSNGDSIFTSSNASAICEALETCEVNDKDPSEEIFKLVDQTNELYERQGGLFTIFDISSDRELKDETSERETMKNTTEVSISEIVIDANPMLDASESTGCAEEICEKDRLSNIPTSNFTSLNFDFPILEVKFASEENANYKSPLEALLMGEGETDAKDHCFHEGNDGILIGKECMLNFAEERETTSSLGEKRWLVDIDDNYVGNEPFGVVGGEPEDQLTHINSYTFASLI